MNNVTLKGIQEYIKRRIANGPVVKSTYISTILKNRRNVLKLTLHEATENICSEAFLSKVERNLMNPINGRVALLCERFNLNYNDLISLENNDTIEKMLKMFFDRDYKNILDLNSCVCEDQYIAQDEIIKAYKAFITKDFKSLQSIVSRLDNIKQCLSDLELFALILIVYEYNFLNLQYEKAYEYLTILDLFKTRNKYCDDYINERKFILCCKSKSLKTTLAFNEIRDNMLLFNYDKNILFTMYYFEAMDKLKVLNFIKGIDKKTINDEFVIDEMNYIYAKSLILINDFDTAFKIIKEYDAKSLRFVTLFAYGIVKKMIYKKNNKEVASRLFVDTEEFKTLKTDLLNMIKNVKQEANDMFNVAFLRLMQYEIDLNEDEVIANYIKNYLIKELEEFSYPLYNEYIIDRYCELLGKLCRYKDAYLFLLKIRKNKK